MIQIVSRGDTVRLARHVPQPDGTTLEETFTLDIADAMTLLEGPHLRIATTEARRAAHDATQARIRALEAELARLRKVVRT
jgi:hypothetical protein